VVQWVVAVKSVQRGKMSSRGHCGVRGFGGSEWADFFAIDGLGDNKHKCKSRPEFRAHIPEKSGR
jgi:hypothetical protein